MITREALLARTADAATRYRESARAIARAAAPEETSMSMLDEFKKFALRGNVVDMAVGIIIGGAFGTIVKSLVDDVMMPPIGRATNPTV